MTFVFVPTFNLSPTSVDKLTNKQIKTVRTKYLDGNDDLSVEKVTRSSKAAGPLYQWAASQIKYSSIYNSIQPLRDEVEKLEKDAEEANAQKETLESEVAQLESSIASCEWFICDRRFVGLVRFMASLFIRSIQHSIQQIKQNMQRSSAMSKH